ncbi:hypothetical protein BH23GEM8_BH23GEM8_21040 [soil metagenome]
MRIIYLLVILVALPASVTTLSVQPVEAQATRGGRAAAVVNDTSAFRTVSGYVACTTAAKLSKLIEHVAREERAAQQAMLSDSTSGCFALRGGLTVTPVGHNEFIVELRPAGMRGTIFTVVEAVEPVGAAATRREPR